MVVHRFFQSNRDACKRAPIDQVATYEDLFSVSANLVCPRWCFPFLDC